MVIPQSEQRVVRELNPDAFNFTKIKEREVVLRLLLSPLSSDGGEALIPSVKEVRLPAEELLDVSLDAPAPLSLPATAEEDVAVVTVLVNASPLLPCQCLFVPNLHAPHPQVLQLQFLLAAISVSRSITRPDFILGFNSLGAFSSVNHFHWQGHFLREMPHWERDCLPVEYQPRVLLEKRSDERCSLSKTTTYPVTAFVFNTEHDDDAIVLCRSVFTFVQYLQEKNIAHQVVVPNPREVFVFPRQLQADLNDGKINIALAELCGIGLWNDMDAFSVATHKDYTAMLAAVALSDEAEDVLQTVAQAALKQKSCLAAPLLVP